MKIWKSLCYNCISSRIISSWWEVTIMKFLVVNLKTRPVFMTSTCGKGCGVNCGVRRSAEVFDAGNRWPSMMRWSRAENATKSCRSSSSVTVIYCQHYAIGLIQKTRILHFLWLLKRFFTAKWPLSERCVCIQVQRVPLLSIEEQTKCKNWCKHPLLA